jgi:ADP-heptose:LPS heptosyltransferase
VSLQVVFLHGDLDLLLMSTKGATFFRLRGSRINKILDRYLGIPILLVIQLYLILTGKRRKAQVRGKKVLVIQLIAIGDAVLTLPALQFLQSEGFDVTVLSGPTNEFVFRSAGFSSEVFKMGKPLKFLQLISRLRRENYDYVLDFIPWPRLSAIIAALFKRPNNRLIGFKTPHQWKHIAFDIAVQHRDDRHEAGNYFSLATAVRPSDQTFNQFSKPANLNLPSIPFIEDELNRRGKDRYVVFHPFAGGYRGEDREWALENYLKLTHFLPQNLLIVVTGSKADLPRATIFNNHDQFVSLCGKADLATTMSVLRQAEFVVSVNTGILHLAAWLGKDIISLNGPTSTVRWGAIKTHAGQSILELNSKAPCSPCLNLGFEYKCRTMICMPYITIQQMVEALRTMTTPLSGLNKG